MEVVTAKSKKELSDKVKGKNPTGKINFSLKMEDGIIRINECWIVCNPSNP